MISAISSSSCGPCVTSGAETKAKQLELEAKAAQTIADLVSAKTKFLPKNVKVSVELPRYDKAWTAQPWKEAVDLCFDSPNARAAVSNELYKRGYLSAFGGAFDALSGSDQTFIVVSKK